MAGATTIRSASRDRRMWPISRSSSRSNRSVKTRSPLIAPADSGVTKRWAAVGHDHAHADAALAQPADEVEALVGGDAAADDEENALGRHVGTDCGCFEPCNLARPGRAGLAVGRRLAIGLVSAALLGSGAHALDRLDRAARAARALGDLAILVLDERLDLQLAVEFVSRLPGTRRLEVCVPSS